MEMELRADSRSPAVRSVSDSQSLRQIKRLGAFAVVAAMIWRRELRFAGGKRATRGAGSGSRAAGSAGGAGRSDGAGG